MSPFVKYPKCPKCKDTFFKFDYEKGLCIQCKPIDYKEPLYVPGVSLDDKVRYADMDKIASVANGDL